jgi:hypothetical protein
MGLNPTGWTVIQFDTPALRFGGYIGAVNEADGGSVTFYDGEGAVIATLPLTIPYGDWAWRGWESDTPFSRVVIHPSANPGTTTVFDDLEVTFVAGVPGDMNCDGVVSVTDIGPFVLALTDPAAYEAQFPDCNINLADLNQDGLVSVGDIGPFVGLLTGA